MTKIESKAHCVLITHHRPSVNRSQRLRQRPQSLRAVQVPRQPAVGAAVWFQARQKLRRRSADAVSANRHGTKARHCTYAGLDQGV